LVFCKYEALLGVLDYSKAIQMYDENKFTIDQRKSYLQKLKFKFFLLSFSQKILIAFLCFSFNSFPLFVHSAIIFIKGLVILFNIIVLPYINWVFDFFKICQEIIFIVIGTFFIKIYFKTKEIENFIIIPH
jgi:hypothetical protein